MPAIQYDSPLVEQYKRRFPFAKLEAEPERGTVVFRYNENITYSVEEIYGMMIQHALEDASKFAGTRWVVLVSALFFKLLSSHGPCSGLVCRARSEPGCSHCATVFHPS